jgi:hypothetical protein
MILVVFGAGASYDSVPSRPPAQYGRGHLQNRPPLGAELFLEDEAVFARNLRAGCGNLHRPISGVSA